MIFGNINSLLQNAIEILGGIQKTLNEILTSVQTTNASVQKILTALVPPLPNSFTIELTSGTKLNQIKEEHSSMKPLKASVDFQILDNGTATATPKAVDDIGEPAAWPAGTTFSYNSNNPNVSVTLNADGITATVAPATVAPATIPVLVTGASIGCTATVPGAAAPLVAPPVLVDTVAGGPTGFAIALS